MNARRCFFGPRGAAALATRARCDRGAWRVGSYAAEAVVRAGVGELTLVDCDTVSVTNINRQLCALTSTVGQRKTEVTARRAADINPDAVIHPLELFYSPEARDTLFTRRFDYIIDAIDTVSAKRTSSTQPLRAGFRLYPRSAPATSSIRAFALCRYLRDVRVPAGPRHAARTAAARRCCAYGAL